MVRQIIMIGSVVLGLLLSVGCGGHAEAPIAEPMQQAVRSHAAVEVAWEDSWDSAFERAHAEGKPVLANFYAEWCVWCKHLETVTFRDQKVADLLADDVIPVNIDIDGDVKGLIRDHHITAPPTIVVFDPSGNELGRIPGYLPPSSFLTVVQKILRGEPVQLS